MAEVIDGTIKLPRGLPAGPTLPGTVVVVQRVNVKGDKGDPGTPGTPGLQGPPGNYGVAPVQTVVDGPLVIDSDTTKNSTFPFSGTLVVSGLFDIQLTSSVPFGPKLFDMTNVSGWPGSPASVRVNPSGPSTFFTQTIPPVAPYNYFWIYWDGSSAPFILPVFEIPNSPPVPGGWFVDPFNSAVNVAWQPAGTLFPNQIPGPGGLAEFNDNGSFTIITPGDNTTPQQSIDVSSDGSNTTPHQFFSASNAGVQSVGGRGDRIVLSGVSAGSKLLYKLADIGNGWMGQISIILSAGVEQKTAVNAAFRFTVVADMGAFGATLLTALHVTTEFAYNPNSSPVPTFQLTQPGGPGTDIELHVTIGASPWSLRADMTACLVNGGL